MREFIHPNARIYYLDQLKGLAIILVVLGHVMQFVFGFSQSLVVNFLAIFHMPLFFLVSGYLSYGKQKNLTIISLSRGLFNKTISLILPLFSWSGIWCAFMHIEYISFFRSGCGGYWFLWCLWISFCILYLLDFCSKKMSMNFFMDIVLFVGVYFIIIFLDWSNYFETLFIHKLVTYLRYFFIGYFLHKYKMLLDYFSKEILYLIGFFFFILQCYFFQYHNIILIFLGGIGAIIVLWNYFKQEGESNQYIYKILNFIGQKTLVIYCVHYFLLSDLSNKFYAYLNVPNGFFIQFVCAMLYAIIICIACLIIENFIRQNKVLNFLLLGRIK